MATASAAPDGGMWAWLAVFACFMGNVIGDGVMYSFGVFIPKFKDHFGAGSGEVAVVYSIQMGVTFASGPVASWMTNKLGWRLTTVIGSVIAAVGLATSAVAPSVIFLYFSGGLLIGLGLGIIYLPRLDCITQYFDRLRPIVTGVAICGSGIGTFIFAPFTQWLMKAVGWQHALFIIAGICLLNCLFGLMFQPLPKYLPYQEAYKVGESNGDALLEKRNEEAASEKKETFKEMVFLLTHVVFMMFAVSNFLTSLGYPIPYTFVPDNANMLGLTPEQGSYLVALIGITNTVARLGLGALSQFVNRLFLYNTCLVVCGLCMAMSNHFQPMFLSMFGGNCTELIVASSLAEESNCTSLIPDLNGNTTMGTMNLEIIEMQSWVCSAWIGQIIYAVTYGVTSAAYVLLTTLVLADLLGADKFTNAFGLLLLFQGVATFIGPPVVGFMFDSSCSYTDGFMLMGAMIAASGAMLYPVPCVQKRMRSNQVNKAKKVPQEMEPFA